MTREDYEFFGQFTAANLRDDIHGIAAGFRIRLATWKGEFLGVNLVHSRQLECINGPSDRARVLASDPASRLPFVSSKWRKFCSNGDGPEALRIISGATSAHDFTTEQAAVPEGSSGKRHRIRSGELGAQPARRIQRSHEAASKQRVAILNIMLGL